MILEIIIKINARFLLIIFNLDFDFLVNECQRVCISIVRDMYAIIFGLEIALVDTKL